MIYLLRTLGASAVYGADDGRAALQVLCDPDRPVDIVISDLSMPGMDGIEFIRTAAVSRRPVAIVAVSAFDSAVLASVESMAAAYGVSLLGVLSKPLTRGALQEVIARHRPAVRAAAGAAANGPEFSLDEMRTGLARDEFEPFLQPKVVLATRRVCGFEALARWRHPVAGVVGPQGFLQLMEEHGLVDDLTWLMVRKSAVCCSHWRAGGHDLCVGVNISVKTLADVQVADRLAAIVAAAGVEPRNVILELTESAAAGDKLGPVLENLARLRIKGFGLAIDDFGTGYSSVQQLGRIAFTELKIDQSFVRNAASQEPAMILLKSTLDMAHRLKLVSVAEGVETRSDWDLLCRLGCHVAQGYFIARPMEAARVLDWLEEDRRHGQPALAGAQ